MDGDEGTINTILPFLSPFGGFEGHHFLPKQVCLDLQGLQTTAGDVS